MKINIGKGIDMEVDLGRFNAEVMEHIQYIGLRNILGDAHASVTPEAVLGKRANGQLLTPEDTAKIRAEAAAVAGKKLQALYAGEIRVAGTRTSDPVEAEMRRISIAVIQAELRKAGTKLSSIDDMVERVRTLLAGPKADAIRKAAVRAIEDRAALAELTE